MEELQIKNIIKDYNNFLNQYLKNDKIKQLNNTIYKYIYRTVPTCDIIKIEPVEVLHIMKEFDQMVNSCKKYGGELLTYCIEITTITEEHIQVNLHFSLDPEDIK